MKILPTTYGIPNIDFEVDILTPREIDIFQRTLLPDKNIAHDLGISYYTVLSHYKSIRQKTGLLDKIQIGWYLGYESGLQKRLIN
ncbi:MAG: LuxR C-terminal-related transcriptional regulator [Mucilaginibacter sp.]|uniref:helix-turn-helix transcriptional regulator n=1 Tax=Mucilaginibacter sp. TaxID=1882438 RepID=UPI003267D4FD